MINLELPDSVVREFFFVAMCMTLHWNQEALSRMAKLNDLFPAPPSSSSRRPLRTTTCARWRRPRCGSSCPIGFVIFLVCS